MPTIAIFHRNFWKSRPSAPAAGVGSSPSMYPIWAASVITMSMSFMGGLIEAMLAFWERMQWAWRVHRQLQIAQLTEPQLAVLERAVTLMLSPHWRDAEQTVAACATTPKFHQPEQWIAYSRAIRADAGQAQNLYRHLAVVQALRAAHPKLTNPELHFLAELAYQGFARIDRRDVKIVHHVTRHIEHPKTLVTH